MQTIPDCTSTCGPAKQLCCRSPISVTIHADTVWQFLQRITPHQYRLAFVVSTLPLQPGIHQNVWFGNMLQLLSCWQTSCPACQTTSTAKKISFSARLGDYPFEASFLLFPLLFSSFFSSFFLCFKCFSLFFFSGICIRV